MKGKEVNVEIGLCDLKNIKDSEQALKEFKMLCYNYQDKWDKTMFDYFMGCINIIDKEIKETANLLEELNNERIMLSGLNEKYKKDLEVLEIIKKNYFVKDFFQEDKISDIKIFGGLVLTENEFNLIKEWLNNNE